jgi:hypothetical protein
MANDCSERVCPFGISHTTTPQGDLNMDGDRYDNTHKAIVYKTGPNAGTNIDAYVSHLDNKLVFSADDLTATEIIVGDEVRIAGYDFVITAADPDGVTFTLDRDNNYAVSGLSGPVTKRLSTLTSPEGPGRVGQEKPSDRLKTRAIFTWNVQTKVFAIVGLECVNALKATVDAHVQARPVQMIATAKGVAQLSQRWPRPVLFYRPTPSV